MLAAAAPVAASWSPVGSPIRPVVTLQLDPGRPELLYARVFAAPNEDYLWRSEDAGVTWHDVQSGLERPVSVLGIDPSNPEVIWVWTSDGQLWRSGDAGNTWSQRYTLPATGHTLLVSQLLIDPHHPGTIYRVDTDENSPGAHVSVSRNGGTSFSAGSSVPLSSSFESIYLDPERDDLVSFDQNGLEISTDGGRTWSVRGQYRGAGFSAGRLAPSAPDVLYGLPLGSNHCLARSDDAGAHWRSLAYPAIGPAAHSSCYDVAIDPRDARHVWVAAQVIQGGAFRSLLFESHDGGTSWSRPSAMPAFGVLAAGGETLYTSSLRGQGLYVSQDGGHTWKSTDQGITSGDLRDGFVAQRLPAGGRRLFALHTPIGDNPDAVYRSDGGKDWVKLPLQQPTAILDAGDSTVLAIDHRGVVRSRNGGDSWQVVAAAPPPFSGLRSNVTQPRYVALQAFEADNAYGKVPLWVSDDGGATWRRSGQGLPIVCTHVASVDWCPDFPAYAVDPFNPNRRWVAAVDAFTKQPRIFISEDAGASWQMATADLSRTPALVPDPRVEGRLLAGTDSGLFVSTDGGAHWLPLGDLPDGAAVRQLAWDANSATWYAATTDRGIYRSLDGGAHWTLLEGAPDHDNPVIAVDPRRPTALLAAFRGQGVWRWVP
jgi:photosystem II stability/assembly factor-like uncharacterized protein